MRLRNVFLLGFCLINFIALPVSAEVMRQTFEFSTIDLQQSRANGYDQLYLKGCGITDHVGHPQLPVKTVHVTLPPGARIEKIEIISSTSEYLDGTFQLFPSQPPRILSNTTANQPFVSPDQTVYNAPGSYPGKLAESAASGGLGGYQVAGMHVYPLQYEPESRRVLFHSRIEAAITYSTGGNKPLASTRRETAIESAPRGLLKSLVANPEKAEVTIPAPTLRKTSLDPGYYEYVIITPNEWTSAFTPLAQWKTHKGVPAKIVTTDWIYSQYAGSDQAEEVRNFIIDAYQNWGTSWVLLGGDWWWVPGRHTWAMDVEYGGAVDENEIPTDWYYSDLDGNWDANMNGIYGEVDDEVDLYPEVFVGRASCDSYGEAADWVNKLILYEMNPPSDYQLNMAFFAEEMWNDPYTDGGVAKDFIDDAYVPARYDPITKLYQSSGNEDYWTVMDALNQGQSIVNHNGHCWIDYMSVGLGGLGGYEMDELTNGPRQTSFLFSIGCWPAALDYDCVAEHFITNPSGGGVAFVGNSRYGWGSPGNPEYGYSDRYDQEFFKALFIDDNYHIGATLAQAKSVLAPHARDENVYRWCYYETNLLGDPEMPIWTDLPQFLFVQHPEAISSGGGEYTITVTTNDKSKPIAGAMVCLWKENDVYERALTAVDGTAEFDLAPSSDGILWITVTSHNFIPYQDNIAVGAGGAYVEYESHTIDDAAGGNGDGIANPGETIDLWMTVENHGLTISNDLAGGINTSASPQVTLLDPGMDFGDVPAGATATSTIPCTMSIDPACPDGEVLAFGWSLIDSAGHVYTGVVNVEVAATELTYYRHRIDDFGGNGVPDPGETCDIRVWVENTGGAAAGGVNVELSTADPLVAITGNPGTAGDIPPEEFKPAEFTVAIDPTCPSPAFVEINMTVSCGGSTWDDSFIMTVGPTGFFDDMESGSPEMMHGGTSDRWVLTSHRTHSGSAAWYCGLVPDWHYDNNLQAWLALPLVILGPNSQLTFWDWFQTTNYGVDGIHVLVTDMDAGEMKTIDFIGSGGALDSALYTGNEWTKESYDLSGYPAGTRVKIQFVFTSDETDYAEGFYIDDIRVESRPDYDVDIEPFSTQRMATVGDTATHIVHVENAGFWQDTYDLSLSGGAWDASIWDAEGSAEITQTGPIPPGGKTDVLLKVVVPDVPAGDTDAVTLTAASAQEPDRTASLIGRTISSGSRGAAPWIDRFLDADIIPDNWPTSGGAAVMATTYDEPTPPYAVNIHTGGSIVSQKIDLTGHSNTYLAFWFKARNTDRSWCDCNLYVEYLAASGIWRNASFQPGEAEVYHEFRESEILLPSDANHADFRVRFRTTTCDGGDWMIDDVYVGPAREYHFITHTSPPPTYAVSGEPAKHLLFIENRGTQIDQYNLSTESGKWNVTFWQDSVQITQTEPLAPGNTALVEVLVYVPETTPTLDSDTSLVRIESVENVDVWRQANLQTVCIGAIADFPWFDDIPESALLTEKWPIKIGADVTWLGDAAPSPPYAMRLNSTDTVLSQKMDLSAAGAAMLEFSARAGAMYMLPGEADSFFVEILLDNGFWERICAVGGGGRWKEEFTDYCCPLPSSALFRGFQILVRAEISNDSWSLDDFNVVLSPTCEVNPLAVEVLLNPDQSTTSPVMIGNSGPGELEYRVEIIPTDLLLANFVAQRGISTPLAKTAAVADLVANTDLLSEFGGPDDYGYMWIDSDEMYGPIFQWEDISGYGQQLLPINSYLYDTLHLGFAFPYYDTAYTELLVSRLGALQFGPASGISDWFPFPIPYPIAPDNILAWCWYKHQTLGTVYAHADANRAIIQFNNFGDTVDVTRTATAQVVLTPDGTVSYRYHHFGANFPTELCGVGIESRDGRNGLGIVFYVNENQEDPNYLHDNLQIDFYSPPSWLSVDPPSGTVAAAGDLPLELDFNSTGLAAGDHDAVLRLRMNDPAEALNSVFVTVRLTVNDIVICHCPLGDLDLDGMINAVDVVHLINYQFRGGPPPPDYPNCPYSVGDCRFDGIVNLSDIVFLVNYVYRNGPAPVDPCPD